MANLPKEKISFFTAGVAALFVWTGSVSAQVVCADLNIKYFNEVIAQGPKLDAGKYENYGWLDKFRVTAATATRPDSLRLVKFVEVYPMESVSLDSALAIAIMQSAGYAAVIKGQSIDGLVVEPPDSTETPWAMGTNVCARGLEGEDLSLSDGCIRAFESWVKSSDARDYSIVVPPLEGTLRALQGCLGTQAETAINWPATQR